MKKQVLLLVILVTILIFIAWNNYGVRPSIKSKELDFVKLPEGFAIRVFVDNFTDSPISFPGPNTGPRMLALNDEGILFVSIPSQGRIVALPDKNIDGKTDEIITFIDGLRKPHGLQFYKGWWYIAEENEVIRVRPSSNPLIADKNTLEVIVNDLPTGGHWTRTIKIKDDKLYISIGSSCNVCNEQNSWRASIIECSLDGKCDVFASGLRNSVGFVFHPQTGDIYATDNGRDQIGDDLPPDEINLIKKDKNYGWPLCYGKNILDTDFHKNDHVHIRADCTLPFENPSLVDLQAHSAPLGLAFYTGYSFPEEYKGNLFVAFHGSWNRKVPTGYKIVTIDIDTLEVRDFATGWLDGNNVKGRPVDIIVDKSGNLLVSDDNRGVIYQIVYQGSI